MIRQLKKRDDYKQRLELVDSLLCDRVEIKRLEEVAINSHLAAWYILGVAKRLLYETNYQADRIEQEEWEQLVTTVGHARDVFEVWTEFGNLDDLFAELGDEMRIVCFGSSSGCAHEIAYNALAELLSAWDLWDLRSAVRKDEDPRWRLRPFSRYVTPGTIFPEHDDMRRLIRSEANRARDRIKVATGAEAAITAAKPKMSPECRKFADYINSHPGCTYGRAVAGLKCKHSKSVLARWMKEVLREYGYSSGKAEHLQPPHQNPT